MPNGESDPRATCLLCAFALCGGDGAPYAAGDAGDAALAAARAAGKKGRVRLFGTGGFGGLKRVSRRGKRAWLGRGSATAWQWAGRARRGDAGGEARVRQGLVVPAGAAVATAVAAAADAAVAAAVDRVSVPEIVHHADIFFLQNALRADIRAPSFPVWRGRGLTLLCRGVHFDGFQKGPETLGRWGGALGSQWNSMELNGMIAAPPRMSRMSRTSHGKGRDGAPPIGDVAAALAAAATAAATAVPAAAPTTAATAAPVGPTTDVMRCDRSSGVAVNAAGTRRGSCATARWERRPPTRRAARYSRGPTEGGRGRRDPRGRRSPEGGLHDIHVSVPSREDSHRPSPEAGLDSDPYGYRNRNSGRQARGSMRASFGCCGLQPSVAGRIHRIGRPRRRAAFSCGGEILLEGLLQRQGRCPDSRAPPAGGMDLPEWGVRAASADVGSREPELHRTWPQLAGPTAEPAEATLSRLGGRGASRPEPLRAASAAVQAPGGHTASVPTCNGGEGATGGDEVVTHRSSAVPCRLRNRAARAASAAGRAGRMRQDAPENPTMQIPQLIPPTILRDLLAVAVAGVIAVAVVAVAVAVAIVVAVVAVVVIEYHKGYWSYVVRNPVPGAAAPPPAAASPPQPHQQQRQQRQRQQRQQQQRRERQGVVPSYEL
eukprot:gene1811-biopygen9495